MDNYLEEREKQRADLMKGLLKHIRGRRISADLYPFYHKSTGMSGTPISSTKKTQKKGPLKCYSSKCTQLFASREDYVSHCIKVHGCKDTKDIEQRRRQSRQDRKQAGKLPEFKPEKRPYACFSTHCRQRFETESELIYHCDTEHGVSDIAEICRRRRQSRKDRARTKRKPTNT